MDLVAGEEFQIPHVCPGELPALLSQVLEGRVLALRGCKATQDSCSTSYKVEGITGNKSVQLVMTLFLALFFISKEIILDRV